MSVRLFGEMEVDGRVQVDEVDRADQTIFAEIGPFGKRGLKVWRSGLFGSLSPLAMSALRPKRGRSGRESIVYPVSEAAVQAWISPLPKLPHW